MKQKILITGGAGYIGAHVVKLLGQAGFDLIVLDNLSTGRKAAVLYGELVIGDVADTELLEKLFKQHQFAAVLHFAGSIIVPESVAEPLKYYSNNTSNSLNLLKICQKYQVNRMVFSSTAAIYGEAEDILSEESTLAPTNPYALSKFMTEMMIRDYHFANPEFNYIVLRYFNVSGADPDGQIGQAFPGATHLIKVACEAALGKRPGISVFGTDYNTADGTGIRDYIHVTDLAQAHVDALNYLLTHKQSYVLNCGYGQGRSVLEVVAAVKKVTGIDFPVTIAGRRPGDVSLLVSKVEKIKSILNWKPQYDDLEFIIKTAYLWEQKLK